MKRRGGALETDWKIHSKNSAEILARAIGNAMIFMSAKRVFFDTNVLIYAYDNTAPAKQAVARNLLRDAFRQGNGVLSAQVLGEFFHVAVIRKALLAAAEAEVVVTELSALPVELIDFPLVLSAVALHKRFGTRYWDSLILAAAKRAGCATVLSEDFNSGQDYDGVRVQNPFTQP